MTQKFFRGDLVQIGEMPPYMFHFTGNCKAIVIATYAEQFGKSMPHHDKEYTLFLLGHEHKWQSSWYEENQLTLIEPNRFDLLPKSNVHRKAWEAIRARGLAQLNAAANGEKNT